MILYSIAAVFPLFCWAFHEWWNRQGSLSEKKKKNFKRGMVVAAILPMFLLFVLRYKYIGSDTIGYVKFFQREIRSCSWIDIFDQKNRFEIGFQIYVKIISLFTSNYTIFFLINAIIIFGTLLRFSFKYTQNPFVFFFLFITLGTYSFFETGLRQALAMVICVWAIDFLQNRKAIRFFLLVILAYYFHKSALIFALAYPLCSIKKYDWAMALYVVLTIVFVVGFSSFQDTFNRWLGYEYGVEKTGNGGIFMLLTLIIAAYSTFMTYDKTKQRKERPWDMHFAFMSVLFWVLRLISRTAERISYYYMFGLYIYFSQAVDCNKDKLSSLLKWLLIGVCLLLFVYRNTGVNYLFYWQGAR